MPSMTSRSAVAMTSLWYCPCMFGWAYSLLNVGLAPVGGAALARTRRRRSSCSAFVQVRRARGEAAELL